MYWTHWFSKWGSLGRLQHPPPPEMQILRLPHLPTEEPWGWARGSETTRPTRCFAGRQLEKKTGEVGSWVRSRVFFFFF